MNIEGSEDSKLVKRVAKIIRWMQERGIDEDGIETAPEGPIVEAAMGKIMLIMVRGPEICDCCNKPQVTLISHRRTQLPLNKLFPAK